MILKISSDVHKSMSYIKKYMLLGLLLQIAIGCVSTQKYSDLLCKKWKHSHEEDEGKIKTFRPADTYTFPRSRFRRVMYFRRDQGFSGMRAGRTDRPKTNKGTWKWIRPGKEVRIMVRKGNAFITDKFEIVSLEPDRLQLKRME